MAYNHKNQNQQQKEPPAYLDSYATVNERLMKFREDYPEGIIDPEIIKWTDDGTIVIQVKIYKTPEDYKNKLFAAKAHAYEKEGSGMINKTSALENCETSAIGRALAMMGYEIKKAIASREEVANAMARREQKQENPIKPQTIGEIKTNWLKLGYQDGDLKRQLYKLYGVLNLTELSEDQGQDFLKKLKALEEAAKKEKAQENAAAEDETKKEEAKAS